MRRDSQRLDDIVKASTAIARYLEREDTDPGVVFDAIRMRMIEIGEAVKALNPEVRALDPSAPWDDAAQMRDFTAHRYFDSDYAVVWDTARYDVPVLLRAVERIVAEHF